MTIEFFTYLLGLALMLYKAEIIDSKQIQKLVDVCKENADKSIEELLIELEDVNKK